MEGHFVGLIRLRFLAAVAAAVILGTIGFGFAAANTVPASSAGDGSGAISGYTVSVVAYGLNATYTLIEVGSGKTVVTGNAASNLSYDNAGTQRFARISGMHDAERRAAKVISEMITTRMSSYFVSGT